MLELYNQNKIVITPADEDCHTVIEAFLTEKYGDAGKKIHTGRSRNDQVLTAVRLYSQNSLQKIILKTEILQKTFLTKTFEYKNNPFPGYTHTQQAMLSSLGHYFSAFAESLENDILFAKSVQKLTNQNPLGSAAGYGVSFNLDREMTTKELGFEKIQINSMYCQQSRGKFESLLLEACAQIMLTLGKYAQDMILFTSQEFNFFTSDDSIVTGSSIMPQKRNLDGLEIMRGHVSGVISKQLEIKEMSKNLISGYHRDLQLMKKPLIESIDITLDSLEIAKIYLENLTPNQEIIESKITKEMFLADIANDMVKNENIPFRDAYMQAFERLDEYEVDFQKNIAEKKSLGSAGNLGV
ncbi:TPA: argininosuccinate lyase [Candidatus Peregrinibacteria bacterium]|nr:argininosuccinate lyase [Candidatus Peregrinibacteria bacterium]